ncbi:hypothetical protein AHAS_Ahas15G0276800 [Arachis hypogaea]
MSSPKIRVSGVNATELGSINILMLLLNERPLSLRDIIVNEKVARNAIIDMVGGLAAIAAMKKRLESQSILPINVIGD